MRTHTNSLLELQSKKYISFYGVGGGVLLRMKMLLPRFNWRSKWSKCSRASDGYLDKYRYVGSAKYSEYGSVEICRFTGSDPQGAKYQPKSVKPKYWKNSLSSSFSIKISKKNKTTNLKILRY